jgi:hypothetical protein
LRYYSNLKNIAVQIFNTGWIVSETQSAIVVLSRSFVEEGDRCGTVAAIRYFAGGKKATRREKDS